MWRKSVKVWFTMVITLLLLLLAGGYIYATKSETDAGIAKQKFKNEVRFISLLAQERLQQHDFQQVQNLVAKWGSNSTEIIAIRLTSKNGFSLAEFKRESDAKHELVETVTIPYSYDGMANLVVRTSIDSVYASQQVFALQLLIGYLFVMVILVLLVYINLHTREQHEVLSGEVKKRRMAEKALLNQHAKLEAIVDERTRELALARDEALKANSAKSLFLANMSHELRTPLNSIIGFSSIIKDGKAGPVNETQAKQLNMLYDSAQHLLEMINDILDLSKIESGKVEVECEEFELDDFMNELVKEFRPRAELKNLELNYATTDEHLRVNTDREKLWHVLQNLLENARKYTEQGSISLGCYKKSDKVVIEVTDTGIGIEKERLDKVFRAFEQVDNSASRQYGGVGLGLAICNEYIRLLKGSLGVESKPGVGSKFRVTLPAG